ncbi:MAG: HAMP domain-containing histidine kinase [Gemmatimonadota bacterium]|nr:HAMP domain-containing histidine kinase [Gemmatimonadota bacterium]MDH3368526.1 HAMP domain-containing histidine kinase [Gemmatimonadota bacterium]MDH3479941.1 HAMP domain-containing histidine kinase [Gemmatimonadota bacterium]
MTIRARLLLAFAAIALLLGMPLAYGIGRLRQVREIAVTLQTNQATTLDALGELRTGLIEFDRQARSYVIAPDPAFRAGMHKALNQALAGADRLAQAGIGSVDTPPTVWLDSLAAATLALEALVEARRAQDATDYLRTTVQPVLVEARSTVAPIGDAINRSSARAATAAQEISAGAIRTALLAGLLALAFGAAVALWTTLTLTRPVRRLRTSMASVAHGVFVAPSDLPYEREDELGDLSRSFRSMTNQLAELERIRGEVLNVVSHDIKAPLNIINGCAELIEEAAGPKLDEQQRGHFRTIHEHVRLLTERVNRMLNLGRIEAQAYPIQTEQVPVVPTFGWVRSAFEPQARHHGIDFTVSVDPSAPAFVEVDPEALHNEIVGNLLSNAFKFTPRGGKVSIRVWGDRTRPSALHFAVIDSGVGIPDEEVSFVFSKYYQAGRKRSDGGVGLGLAIVRQLVEAHGGTVDVESRSGGGTIFHVMLPGTVPERRVETGPPMRGALRLPAGPSAAPVEPQPAGTERGTPVRRWLLRTGRSIASMMGSGGDGRLGG